MFSAGPVLPVVPDVYLFVLSSPLSLPIVMLYIVLCTATVDRYTLVTLLPQLEPSTDHNRPARVQTIYQRPCSKSTPFENTNHITPYKRFTAAEDISGTNIVKSSVQRNIRKDIIERYPAIEPYMDDVMPKKEDVYLTKCSNKITLISCGREPLFFQDGNGPYIPCLRVIHKGTTYY